MSDLPYRPVSILADEICEDIIELLEQEGRIPYFNTEYHRTPMTEETDANIRTFRRLTDLVEAHIRAKVKEMK
jgi:hypothetical protein